MMIKKIFVFLSSVIFIILITGLQLLCYADDITLWASIDDSSTQANLLTDLMVNDVNYEPFYQHVIVRAGERDYRIYFGKSIDAGDLTLIRYTPAYAGATASITRETGKTITIQSNGYYYTGNIPGSAANKLESDYKTGIIVSVSAITLILLFLFRIFRRTEKPKDKFLKVR